MFAQALDYVVHRDVACMREAPPFFSERDWPSEVRKAFWALWRKLEAGAVHSTEDSLAVDRFRWRNDRLAHLEPYEALKGTHGLRLFIVEARKATHRVLIPAADVLAVFPALTQPAASESMEPSPDRVAPKPRVARKRKRPAPVGKPLTPKQRKIKTWLLHLYPDGRGLDTYDVMLSQLKGKKVITSRPTLARVLSQMPDKWRENR
jgi:hypothetical protein